MNRLLSFAIFFSVMVLIVGGVHFFFWLRLVRDTALGQPWRLMAKLALVALALSLPASFILARTLSLQVARWVFFPVYVWMGLMLLLLSFLLMGELLKLVLWLVSWLQGGELIQQGSRRLLLARTIAAGAVLLASGATVVAVNQALRPPVIKTIEVRLARLSPSQNGLRLVQLTDLHLGPILGRLWLERVVDRVNALQPDLVVITGDLVDGDVALLRPVVAPLKRLKTTDGVFFVTGNHEYYSGVQPWLQELPELGIRVLDNARVTVGHGAHSFDLVGLSDPTARGFQHDLPRLEQVLAGRDPHRALVLLAHQPRAIFEAAANGVGLQLSGHTHGGQIWPWNYLVYLQQPYLAGLSHYQDTTIYVSEGTGFWGPPMRLGTRCEITLLILMAQD
jgi:uncharacterized protein